MEGGRGDKGCQKGGKERQNRTEEDGNRMGKTGIAKGHNRAGGRWQQPK